MQRTPNVHALGTHNGHARSLTHTLRSATRTPTLPHLVGDLDSARHELWTWARTLDIDIDAITWVPGHDGTPGPGHTCAQVIADALGIALIATCERTQPTPSAHHTRRLSAPQHAATIAALPINAQRIALVDNTIATAHTITGCSHRLQQHGHHVTDWIAVTDAR